MAATPSGTTTQFHPVKFTADEKLHLVGTSTYIFRSTHVVAFPASSGAQGLYGCFRVVPVSTLRDCIQIPVDNFASRLGMFVVFDLAASSDTWPVVAVRIPPMYSTRYSPDNTPGIGLPWAAPHVSTAAVGMGGIVGTSTLDSGWRLITSTASYSGATSAPITYMFGPLDAAKYAMVAASSGDQTDKYQPYFEFVFGMSSKPPVGATSTSATWNSTGVQWSAFSTSGLSSDIGSSAGHIFLLPFELP